MPVDRVEHVRVRAGAIDDEELSRGKPADCRLDPRPKLGSSLKPTVCEAAVPVRTTDAGSTSRRPAFTTVGVVGLVRVTAELVTP